MTPGRTIKRGSIPLKFSLPMLLVQRSNERVFEEVGNITVCMSVLHI